MTESDIRGMIENAIYLGGQAAFGKIPTSRIQDWTAQATEMLNRLTRERDASPDGCELIRRERERQIHGEGWSEDHDDAVHRERELVQAAIAYAMIPAGHVEEAHRLFPWAKEWWKPSADPVRNLVKAGALIAAEIDRLQRLNGE